MSAAAEAVTATTAPASRSAAIRRTGLAPAAWGAALILAGMGAAVIVSSQSGVPARAVGGLAVALGVAGIVWAGWCLSRGTVLAPRTALGGIMVSLGCVAALLATTGGRASIIAAAVVVALLLASAILTAGEMRHRAAPTGVRMAPLLIAATLVTLLATPALGAVQDAATVRSDGTIPVIDPHQGH
ncbi:hypothetical protein [Microbacterium flavum]|uniref:hypothetical protein n=1 Tax=Microbacterium flavum TaxID=415216 RepID=UPI0024AE4D7E|nr:hypothetical protein [Microbacterium flavum]